MLASAPDPQSTTPNLDRLEDTSSVLRNSVTLVAQDPAGVEAFQIDYEFQSSSDFWENKYAIRLPSGEQYTLRTQTEPKAHAANASLQFPDHSIVSMRYADPKKATLSFGKLRAPLDMTRSQKGQFKSNDIRQIRDALPESGKTLVDLFSHLRGDLCREAGFCGGFADGLLDLFRKDEDVEDFAGFFTENESGWTIRKLNERNLR